MPEPDEAALAQQLKFRDDFLDWYGMARYRFAPCGVALPWRGHRSIGHNAEHDLIGAAPQQRPGWEAGQDVGDADGGEDDREPASGCAESAAHGVVRCRGPARDRRDD